MRNFLVLDAARAAANLITVENTSFYEKKNEQNYCRHSQPPPHTHVNMLRAFYDMAATLTKYNPNAASCELHTQSAAMDIMDNKSCHPNNTGREHHKTYVDEDFTRHVTSLSCQHELKQEVNKHRH